MIGDDRFAAYRHRIDASKRDFVVFRVRVEERIADRRHRLTFNWTYEPQWFRDASNWALKNLAGNWRWVGTYTYESPEFVTAQSGQDSNLNLDTAGDRTVVNSNGDPTLGSDVTALRNNRGDVVGYLADNPNAMYIRAGLGVWPNGGRNTLPTRPINNFDMSFAKKFTVREGQTLEFRGDFSNVFNHPQYTPGFVNSVKLQQTYTTSRTFFCIADTALASPDKCFSRHCWNSPSNVA